jgi:hypothetical protein
MKQKIILCFKGILLYTTVTAIILFICAIDGLFDNGWLIEAGLIIVGLIYTCYRLIDEEELDVLCLNKLFKPASFSEEDNDKED